MQMFDHLEKLLTFNAKDAIELTDLAFKDYKSESEYLKHKTQEV